MRHIKKIAARTAACVALVGGGALAVADPAAAAPAEPAPPAPAATSTVSLPLLGAPVTVAVTTDAGGGLLDVSLSPADTLTANPVHLNHVSFVNEEGTVKLRVAAVRGGERVSARAGSLAEISGPGGWSGDVFGTGVTTDVAFTVDPTADGGPDISGVTVNSSVPHAIGPVEYDQHDDSRSAPRAKVTIQFEQHGQRRWLTIEATAASDGASQARLKVSLSRPWGARLSESTAVGAHTWTGILCDGTAATVNYTVTEAGEITDVVATPEADVRPTGRFVWVGFGRFERVSLFAHESGDGLDVGAVDTIRCARTGPTVNGGEAERAERPNWDDGRPGQDGWDGDGGNDGWHDHDGNHDGDDDRDHDHDHDHDHHGGDRDRDRGRDGRRGRGR